MLRLIPAWKLRPGEGTAPSLVAGLTLSTVHCGLLPPIHPTGTTIPQLEGLNETRVGSTGHLFFLFGQLTKP